MMTSIENHRRELMAAGIHRTVQYFQDYERRFRKSMGNPAPKQGGCDGKVCRMMHIKCEHYHGCSDQCRYVDGLIKPQVKSLKVCPKK